MQMKFWLEYANEIWNQNFDFNNFWQQQKFYHVNMKSCFVQIQLSQVADKIMIP